MGSYAMVVSPEHLASRFKDPMLPPVLATPVMILAMENAALAALKPYLEPGESALGTHVDVKHLAATPVGRRITASATVLRVSGRSISFSVRATDGDEVIGSGTHERMLIDIDRFTARLAGKAGDGAGH
jgi:fluoroacetyl-CoA thioesterase